MTRRVRLDIVNALSTDAANAGYENVISLKPACCVIFTAMNHRFLGLEFDMPMLIQALAA